MNKPVYDMIVIGGGPGGYTAALYAARNGLSVLVLEKLSPGGQMASTAQIDNYPGFEEGLDGFELGEKMQKGAERFGAETRLEKVTAVDLLSTPKKVTLRNEVLLAQTIVISTGAYPRELGLPGEKELRSKGVAYCASCDGMQFKNKVTAVNGGGNSAVTDALLLARLCKKVYLIHRRDSLRASAVYTDALKRSGVEILWNSQVSELLRTDRLTGLKLKNTITGEQSELSCDGLFVAIGRIPDTSLFNGLLEMDTAGYLKADETTRTSLPGVFAVGDVRTKPLRQIVTAAADGAVAAHFAAEYISEQNI